MKLLKKYLLQNRSIFRALVTLFFCMGSALLWAKDSAGADSTGLGGMATGIQSALSSFEGAIATGAYVIGLGFAVGAILKFKQHKDNPSNVPIGTPIALLLVAVALVFLPSLIELTGQSAKLTKSAESGFDFGGSGTKKE